MATLRPSGVVSAAGYTVVGAANAAAAVNEISPSQAERVHTIVNGANPLTYSLDGTAPAGQHEFAAGLYTLDGSAYARMSLLDGDDTELAVGNWQEINTTPTTYSWVLTTASDASRVRVEFQAGASALLLEDGSYLLMETGDRLLLE